MNMKMNDTVARIVEIMFQDVEENEEVAAIRDEVIALAKDAEGNAEKIIALKNKMNRRKKLESLWDKAKLVLKISK